MATKRKTTWNPAHHPRDSKGRFIRSATKVMKPADRKRAAAGMQGFQPAEIGDPAAAQQWLQRAAAATPSADGGAIGRYLDGGWRDTNPALRSGKPVTDLDQLDTAFTPLQDDVMLRRIVPTKMFNQIPLSDLVGMKMRDAAPASTSVDRPGPPAPGAVTMHIATPAGTRAYVHDEAGEVLLARDTEVAITDAKQNADGGWEVWAVVIPAKDAPDPGEVRRRRDTDTTDGPDGEVAEPPAAAEPDATDPDPTVQPDPATTPDNSPDNSTDDGGDETAPRTPRRARQRRTKAPAAAAEPAPPADVPSRLDDPRYRADYEQGWEDGADLDTLDGSDTKPDGWHDGWGDRFDGQPKWSSTLRADQADQAAAAAHATRPAPTAKTWQDHGAPTMGWWYGGGRTPEGFGQLVTLSYRDGDPDLFVRDARTGERLELFPPQRAMWLTPQDAPTDEPDSGAANSLADSIASGVLISRPLPAGESALAISVVEFRDGQQAIWKMMDDGFPRTMSDASMTAEEQVDAEILGAAVASAFGLRAPDVVQDPENQTAAYIELLPGKTGTAMLSAAEDLAEQRRRYVDSDDGKRLGLVDLVIGATDRNDDNWLDDGSGRIAVIDHAAAFDFADGDAGQPRVPGAGKDKFQAHYISAVDGDQADTGQWTGNPLTARDVETGRARLAALRPQFEARGRQDWHDAATARFEAIAAHASGDRDLLSVEMPDGTGQAPTAADMPVADQVLAALHDQYQATGGKPGDMLKLSAVRARLSGLDRDQVDEQLRALDRAGRISLEPDPARGELTDADQAAAIRIGPEDKQLINTNEPDPRSVGGGQDSAANEPAADATGQPRVAGDTSGATGDSSRPGLTVPADADASPAAGGTAAGAVPPAEPSLTDLADEDLPAPAPTVTDGVLGEFTPVEQARIRAAVEDKAGQYAASPLIGRSIGDIGRYIGEGGDLADIGANGRWRKVADAAREILTDEPELMSLTSPAQREAWAKARRDRAQQVFTAAESAYRAGDYARALDLMRRGELIDPGFRPLDRPWSRYQEVLQRKLTETTSGANGDDPDARVADRPGPTDDNATADPAARADASAPGDVSTAAPDATAVPGTPTADPAPPSTTTAGTGLPADDPQLAAAALPAAAGELPWGETLADSLAGRTRVTTPNRAKINKFVAARLGTYTDPTTGHTAELEKPTYTATRHGTEMTLRYRVQTNPDRDTSVHGFVTRTYRIDPDGTVHTEATASTLDDSTEAREFLARLDARDDAFARANNIRPLNDATTSPPPTDPTLPAGPGALPADAPTLAAMATQRSSLSPAERRQVEAYIRDRIGTYTDGPSGITATISQLVVSGATPTITYRLDHDGEYVGDAIRGIHVNTNTGTVYVNHEVLSLDANMQGAGFAGRFNAWLDDFYAANGVDQVRLYANSDVGGYAWARAGFDFEDPWAAQGVIDNLGQVLGSPEGRQWPEDVQEQARTLIGRVEEALTMVNRARPDADGQFYDMAAVPAAMELMPTPLEFAMLGWTPDSGNGKAAMWPGKQFMLGQSWSATRRVRPADEPTPDTQPPAAGTDAPTATPAAPETPAPALSPATTTAGTALPSTALPRTQARALDILRSLGDREVSEYKWRTAGAGIAAIKALTRKGYVTERLGPFKMPTGPYAGETLDNQSFYTLADRQDATPISAGPDGTPAGTGLPEITSPMDAVSKSSAALTAGDYDQALAYIAAGERMDPSFGQDFGDVRIGWATMRDTVIQQRDLSPAVAGPDVAPPLDSDAERAAASAAAKFLRDFWPDGNVPTDATWARMRSAPGESRVVDIYAENGSKRATLTQGQGRVRTGWQITLAGDENPRSVETVDEAMLAVNDGFDAVLARRAARRRPAYGEGATVTWRDGRITYTGTVEQVTTSRSGGDVQHSYLVRATSFQAAPGATDSEVAFAEETGVGSLTAQLQGFLSPVDADPTTAGTALPTPDQPAGPATQLGLDGSNTEFTPADRSTIGVAARADVGRTRGMAAEQQLGLFASDEQEIVGQGALLGALMNTFEELPSAPPPVDAPPPAEIAAANPDTPDTDQALRPFGDWSDEQLVGAWRELTEAPEAGPDEQAALDMIWAEWEARGTRMQAMAALLPDDLTVLDDQALATNYAELTAGDGPLVTAAVARLSAELDRRDAAAVAANDSIRKRQLLAGDLQQLTDTQLEDAAGVAVDLDDQAALIRIGDEFARREQQAEVDRANAQRAGAERRERELAEAEEAARQQAAVVAAAEAQVVEQAMAAARAAAVLEVPGRPEVLSSLTTLGKQGTEDVLGADRVAALTADAVKPWMTRADQRTAARQDALADGLTDDERVRLVYAVAGLDTDSDVRALSDDDLNLDLRRLMFGQSSLNTTAEREARRRMLAREVSRRRMEKIRADDEATFEKFRDRARTMLVRYLSDRELEAAPAALNPADPNTPARAAALATEAQRRIDRANDRAARRAAGPDGPARVASPVQALGALDADLRHKVGLSAYGRSNGPTIPARAREAQRRLQAARALALGLPEDADDKAIKAAEKTDGRGLADRAALSLAWYRHLAEFADPIAYGDDPHDWQTGPADDPDLPDVLPSLPPANVSKPVAVWEEIKQQALADRAAGDMGGARRWIMAHARAYGVAFNRDAQTEDELRTVQDLYHSAFRFDPRTEAQTAAALIAEFRRLAAEDGVDPDDTRRYGPPDKRAASKRNEWVQPTADEQIRINRLVADGVDSLDAYAQVMRMDVEQLQRRDNLTAQVGTTKPTAAAIKGLYIEWAEEQYNKAETDTNGNLLNPKAKAKGINPGLLFTMSDRDAYRWASEELLRWWAENPRLTFAAFKAQLVGDTRTARTLKTQGTEGNEFA